MAASSPGPGGLLVPGPFEAGTVGGANLTQAWSDWEEGFTFYLLASGKDGKAGKVKIATLLNQLGREGRTVYRGLDLTDTEKESDYDKVLKGFRDYYTPKINDTFESHKFFSHKQRIDESFDSFLNDIRTQLKLCNYPEVTDQQGMTLTDRLLRDQIVLGINSDTIREELLYTTDLTLQKAINICRHKESAALIGSQLNHHSTTSVQAVKHNTTNTKSTNSTTKKIIQIQNCKYCGGSHLSGACPAYGKECHKCGKSNHFATVCNDQSTHVQKSGERKPQNKQSQSRRKHKKNAHMIEISDHRILFEISSTAHKNEWMLQLMLENNKTLLAKADTGAGCNVMCIHQMKYLFPKAKLDKCRTTLEAYGGTKLEVLGKTEISVEHNGTFYLIEFVIVNEEAVTLIGLPTLRDTLKLVPNTQIHEIQQTNTEKIVQENATVFEGDGKLPGKHNIQLSQGHNPVIHTARRVPFRLRDQLKETLLDMEKRGMIAKVTTPTEWVNPIVIVPKPNGTLRICLDPLHLNQAVLREHYQVPTAEEIFAKVSGSTVFSTLDAMSGFMQIELDEQSSYLCTFGTCFGRWRFLRLPYGVTSSPEVFQRTLAEHFSGMEGVEIYIDDILIHGKDKVEHDKRLMEVMNKCKEINLKLNKDKCKFGLTELKYLGQIVSKDGLKIDPKRIAAICNMPTPTDKDGLRRFLGMVNYVTKFCPNLSEKSSILRDLLRNDVEYTWNACHDKCYEGIKTILSSPTTLKLFDVHKPVTVSVDASKSGIGAVLLQDNQPVEYASCTMTTAQQHYAQIEKEMLAIEFGLTRFHQYIYGQKVTVETDHKPLVGLIKKPIADVSPRLARMRLKCLPYDAYLIYKPGKELVIADTMSRAYLAEECDNQIEQEIVRICDVLANNTVKEEMVKATAADATLQAIVQMIRNGWPNKRNLLPNAIKPFWNVKDDLCEYDGLLFKGDQMVIPSTMIPSTLKEIHNGHMGISKCLERAKSAVFWPGYSTQVKDIVESCGICQQHRNANMTEKLSQFPIPEYPQQVVSTDLFELDNQHYVLTVDMYSKWPCVRLLRGLRSSDVIKELKDMFTDFGIPERLITDNGPQYGSQEFRNFCMDYKIQHTTSSPTYAQSNGLSERHVQNAKGHLKKMRAEGKGLLETLTAIRSTPIGNGLPSPAMLLQSRNLRCNLLNHARQLTPKVVPTHKVRTVLAERQGIASWYHKSSTRKSILWPGQSIRYRQGTCWYPGTVIRHAEEPQSYIIETMIGNTVRRTRSHINIDKTQPMSQMPNIIHTEPDRVTPQPTVNTQTPVKSSRESNPYVTRSGRQVVKPQRYG